VLDRLEEAHCDPEVALRLAFLVVSDKPAAKSELVGENARQQRIKRKLGQARNYLLKAAFGLMNAALPEFANNREKTSAQCGIYLRKAVGELEQALSDLSLIFIKPEDVESLKASVELTDPQDAALSIRFQDLARMCDHEIETLIWPRTVALHPGHELFTLVSYLTACGGAPNFVLVTDLLTVANEAYDVERQPAFDDATEPLTQDAIIKRVQRFRSLDSIQPQLIEESMAQRAKSGQLRRELLSCYPDHTRA
jgi:hypothetical protein